MCSSSQASYELQYPFLNKAEKEDLRTIEK